MQIFLLILGMMLVLATHAHATIGTCTSAQLLSEFQADPSTIGYAAAYGGPITANSSGNDNALLDAYILKRQGAAYQVGNTGVRRTEVMKAIVLTEADSLSVVRTMFLEILLTTDPLDFTDSALTTQLRNIFTPATTYVTTRQNLSSLQNRQGNRAEVLCGVVNNAPTLDDISFAIRGVR
jgi:hypothetical protein